MALHFLCVSGLRARSFFIRCVHSYPICPAVTERATAFPAGRIFPLSKVYPRAWASAWTTFRYSVMAARGVEQARNRSNCGWRRYPRVSSRSTAWAKSASRQSATKPCRSRYLGCNDQSLIVLGVAYHHRRQVKERDSARTRALLTLKKPPGKPFLGLHEIKTGLLYSCRQYGPRAPG